MAPRTPLLHPNSYFDERSADALRGFGIVALVTLAFLAAVFAVGLVLAARIDGTVLVDNPAYPGASFCEGGSSMPLPPEATEGCSESPQIERNVDRVLWDGVGSVAARLLLVPGGAWLLTGALLHVGSWLAGGEGGVSESVGVAAWGLAPAVVSAAAGVTVLALTFDPVTVAPGVEAAAYRADLFSGLDTLERLSPLFGLVAAAWGGVIWFAGLRHARGLGVARAGAVAGAVAVLTLLGA